jgi:hypothetical protein
LRVGVGGREEGAAAWGVVGDALRVGDVFIVDEDFGNRELRDCCHAALFLLIHGAPEAAGPVECVEEADDDIAAYGFFDALEAGAAPEEFF